MSLQAIEASFKEKLGQLGRVALSALYSKDFEAYVVALQLCNSNGDTVDYFSWPVLPDEIRETHSEITLIRKTIGGVYVLKNTTFNPRQISMSGTFGKRFKIVINNTPVSFAGFSLSQKNGKFNITPPNFLGQKVPEFSSFAKTGYGCVKVLESMKEKSKQLDENGKPHVLYFYNPVLGNNYQVEFNNFTHMQDSSQYNMLPAYSLQMTAVASLDSLLGSQLKSAIKNLSIGVLQKSANNIATNLKSGLTF